MKRFLALLVAFAVAAVPVAASAVVPVPVSIVHDDGVFESSTPVSLPLLTNPAALPIPVVQFDAPTADLYALDEVKFFLLQAPVAPAVATVPLVYPVTLQIWTPALPPAPITDWVAAEPLAADLTVEADLGRWYTLDLKGAKFTFTGPVRIGITRRDDASVVPALPPEKVVPVPEMPLNLGLDTSATGFSFIYDPVAVPPTWTPDTTGNYGIQASVHLVPAMTCQGFLPPFNKTITMKKGGRTIPLKAFLFDELGAPATRKVLAASPLVELLWAPDAVTPPVDVTDYVAHPGRCNKGQAFRPERRGKWHYNLKTKKSLLPGIYTVQMESGDGAEYVIDPTCTGTFVIEAPKPKPSPKDKDHGKK